MSNHELVGGTDNLIVDGKVYRVGDTVPLSKAQRLSLEQSGHRFADTDPDDVAAAVASASPPAAETAARGDRGEVLNLPTPRPRASAPASPAANAASPKSE